MILLFLGLANTLGRRSPSGIKQLTAAVTQQPGSPRPRLRLASAYLRAGRGFAAVEQLEAARALGYRDELLTLRLADLYRSLGDPQAAERVLIAAETEAPSPRVRFALADARTTLGDFEGAAKALEELKPEPGTERERVARHLLLAGHAEESERLLESTAADAEALALRGLAVHLRHDDQAAEIRLLEASRLEPEDAWTAYLQGRMAEAAGDRQAALSAFRASSVRIDPPVRARIGAARVLARIGDSFGAAGELTQAGTAGEEDPEYWSVKADLEAHAGRAARAALARGQERFWSGEPQAAEAIWRIALAGGPPGAEARELLAGLVRSSERRYDTAAALEYAARGARRWPGDPLFLRRQAELLLGTNRYEEALKAARQLERVAPPEEVGAVADLLARIGLDGGRKELLVQSAERCRIYRPNDPAPDLLLAEWYENQGREPDHQQQALALYRHAAALAPDDAETNAKLGSLLAALKQNDEAVRVLQHALERNPHVLDGVPSVQLARIYRLQGRSLEAQLHEARYTEARRVKDRFVELVPALRQPASVADCAALGETALARSDPWLALVAYRKAVDQAPRDARYWRGVAAAQKRLGRFEEALEAMRRAYLLTTPAGAGRP